MKTRLFLVALLLALLPAQTLADTPWQLVARHPHDKTAFTEGLLIDDGVLYESTGQNGASTITKRRLADGKLLKKVRIEPRYFGEGIVVWGDRLASLTWRDGIGFLWDRKTLKRKGSFRYAGEGWALTRDDRRIIMSDGTATLRFLDPETMKPNGTLDVTWRGAPLTMLNELEYVRGEILANIWMTDYIARIDPASGEVIDLIDLSALAREQASDDPDAVLNGIAYDARADRLFVTGKNWTTLYEIRLDRGDKPH